LLTDWPSWARESQIPSPYLENGKPWSYWLILAGRGWGKTRTGAEWMREAIKTRMRVNLIAATSDDARDIMIEGESGILSCCSEYDRPIYDRSKRRLRWPNGAISLIFTADEPERLRGKQHEALWCDELAAWRYAEAWDQAKFGLRLGCNPVAVITTTPRPTAIIKEILEDPDTLITRGTTYDNKSNLSPKFFDSITRKYEGTRLGRQELEAQLLTDNPDALWNRGNIEKYRVTKFPALKRLVVGVDPQAALDGAETGIIIGGIADVAWAKGMREEAFILGDNSLRAPPAEWAKAVLTGYNMFSADRIVAEVNQGGEMVRQTIATAAAEDKQRVAYKAVRASRGKVTRAEPVSALYEQGCVHHVGSFPVLEDQLCDWMPGQPSPDRLDALVWAVTDLLVGRSKGQAHGW